MKLEVVLH